MSLTEEEELRLTEFRSFVTEHPWDGGVASDIQLLERALKDCEASLAACKSRQQRLWNLLEKAVRLASLPSHAWKEDDYSTLRRTTSRMALLKGELKGDPP